MEIILKNNRAYKAYQLAMLCTQSGKFTEALAHFCVVGTLVPQKIVSAEFKKSLLLAFEGYVTQCMQNSDLKDVFACYNEIFGVFPHFEEIPHKISCLFLEIGEHQMAKTYLEKSLEINPCFIPAIMCMDNINNYLIERWNFRMLNDRNRNFKYQLAIKKALMKVKTPPLVLDIGTGTGLLSIFASQAGAKNIFACDSSSTMCNICEKVVKANYSDSNVRVINKSSLDLEVENDIPSKISLIVSEIFDAGLFGEGVLATLKHAWDKLLITDPERKGVVIPYSAIVYFSLIQCPWIAMKNKVVKSNIDSFTFPEDLILISEEEYDDPYSSEFLNNIPGGYVQLSKPEELLRINFNDSMEISEFANGKYFKKDVNVEKTGSCDAIAVWFDLNVDEEISISTSSESSTCWEQAIFPTKDNLFITPDSLVSVEFSCKDLLRLTKVTVDNPSQNCRKLRLPSAWIRKLNDAVHCNYVELSVKEALANGRQTFIDASPIPLGGMIAAKLGATDIVFTEEAAPKWIVYLCKEFEIAFTTMNFYSITKLIEIREKYDCLIFDPVDQNGMMSSGVLQDLALLRTASLLTNCNIIPKCLTIWTKLIQSSLILDYTRVTSDQNVFGLKISEFINKFKTKFFEDFRLENLPHQTLVGQSRMARVEFKCPIEELSSGFVPEIDLIAIENGKIDAIPFWFEIIYSENRVLNTLESSSYSQAAVIPDDSLPVTKRQVLKVQPSYIHSIVYFNISSAQAQCDVLQLENVS